MHIQDLILLVIESEEGKCLQGRTLLQKKLYFLSELMGVDHGFRPHYYGPYSSSVAANLDMLVNGRFLIEVTETFETDQNIFGEMRRHSYTLTSDGELVLIEIKRETGYADCMTALNQLNRQKLASDFNLLSIAAKVCYIVKKEQRTTTSQVRQIAQEYGWDLNMPQIENVRSFLQELSLISV